MVSILLFPGQGAQRVGMTRDLADRFPAARDTLVSIDAAVGAPLSQLMWEGPDEELQQTLNTQPAVLAHSAAVLAVIADQLLPIGGAAGHSLGEYSAYLAAGSLGVADAARLVRRRGDLMQAAGAERPGAMSAVLGLAGEVVEGACAEASGEGVGVAVAANLNAPDQTVISGDPPAVSRASERCKLAGAKRVLPLKVSGAFHSPLMAPAQPGLAEALGSSSFADPRFPVVANATAEPVTEATRAMRLLVDQVISPVRWVECIKALAALGGPDARFLEIGPGAVLTGLLKRIIPGATYASLGTADEVERFLTGAPPIAERRVPSHDHHRSQWPGRIRHR